VAGRWARAAAAAAWLLPAAVGCGQGERVADPGLEITPIQIDRVEVLVQKTPPPHASAHVRGVIGDGCSTLHSVEQARSGKTVTLTVLRERPKDAICTQIARLYDETIPLEGTFPAGAYVLDVNGTETPFTTD
jgi:hypothetical protein